MYSGMERELSRGLLFNVNFFLLLLLFSLRVGCAYSCSVELVASTTLETRESISLKEELLFMAARWACAFCKNQSFSKATTVLPRVIFRLNW